MLPKEEDEAKQRSYIVDLTALWIELHCGSDCTVDRATQYGSSYLSLWMELPNGKLMWSELQCSHI